MQCPDWLQGFGDMVAEQEEMSSVMRPLAQRWCPKDAGAAAVTGRHRATRTPQIRAPGLGFGPKHTVFYCNDQYEILAGFMELPL